MKTRCSRWELLLERFHDGELKSKAERARVEAHVAACEGCKAQLQQLEGLGRVIPIPAAEALARVPAARMDAMWTRIAARLEEEPRASWRERLAWAFDLFWGNHGRMVLTAAGAACLTLLIAWPLLRPAGPGGGSTDVRDPALTSNEVIVDSLQTGEHDMVLVNVHPEDMTTVIWLLNDNDDAAGAGQQAPVGDGAAAGSPDAGRPDAAAGAVPRKDAGGAPGPGGEAPQPAAPSKR